MATMPGLAFYGIQIGDGTNYAGNCTVTAAWIQGCNSGAVRLLSDDGNNRIQATCDQNSGVLYVGSITAGTELTLSRPHVWQAPGLQRIAVECCFRGIRSTP